MSDAAGREIDRDEETASYRELLGPYRDEIADLARDDDSEFGEKLARVVELLDKDE